MALRGGTFVTGTGAVHAGPWVEGDAATDRVPLPETETERHWLGPELWGNRLQDWHVDGGRLECLRGEAGYELRTVGVLTHELVSGDAPGHLRVRTDVVDGADGGGFSGFLVGVGNGDLAHQAAALAGRSSGVGGGTLCTCETDGRVRFRDHTDEEARSGTNGSRPTRRSDRADESSRPGSCLAPSTPSASLGAHVDRDRTALAGI